MFLCSSVMGTNPSKLAPLSFIFLSFRTYLEVFQIVAESRNKVLTRKLSWLHFSLMISSLFLPSLGQFPFPATSVEFTEKARNAFPAISIPNSHLMKRTFQTQAPCPHVVTEKRRKLKLNSTNRRFFLAVPVQFQKSFHWLILHQ